MEKIQFKTNIKCSGCIAKASPFLDEAVGKENWQVDIANPAKILSVGTVNEKKVLEAVEKAGFKAEKLPQ
jgi:copper chaperone